MIENKLGEIISKLRKEKDLTQKELADKLGISDKAVSRWETGKSFPSLEMTYQISKFFNVSFNDLMKARMSDDEGNEVVEAIIKEFTEMSKKSLKRIKIFLITTLVIIVALTIAMIFTSTYNRFKVYRVYLQSEDFNNTFGNYVETKIKDILYLGNISIKNVNIKNTDTVSLDLYYIDNKDEKIIYTYHSLDNVVFYSRDSYIKIDDLSDYLDNLYLKVTIIDKDNNVKEYKSKIEFRLDFSNNKLYDIPEELTIPNLDTSKIEFKLLQNGFKELSNSMIGKTVKNYKVIYFKDSNKLEYTYEKNNLQYKYTYNFILKELKVYINNDENVKIEDYLYDVENEKILECNIGNCNNFNEALKILNRDVFSLLDS